MVVQDQHIELIVRRITKETPGYFSVYFERPANFTFNAGDWIDIQPEGQKLAGGVTYSLSSSPTESDIRITFREGISEFKRTLQSVKPHDSYIVSQYGNDYGFQLNQNQSSVLIAGGVGIAPFRSMLKEMYDNRAKSDVSVIYLNQNDNFLFQDELESWRKELPNLTTSYISTKEINRKEREKLILSLIKSPNQNFYIAGPPGMVESNEHLLIDAGVPVRNIKIDSFGGY